jgi:hypothetical protein
MHLYLVALVVFTAAVHSYFSGNKTPNAAAVSKAFRRYIVEHCHYTWFFSVIKLFS